jgi:hypothetical protein
MILVGFFLKQHYPLPCARLPLFITPIEVTPIFIYTVSYVTFERAVSTYMGTRIRGVLLVHVAEESMWNPRYIEDIWLFKFIGLILNIIYVYELLKKFEKLKFVISVTRLQSRLTGYICKCYVPVFLRSILFGSFGLVYGVKMHEATKPDYSSYTTFTDFFTRTLTSSARKID